MLMIMLKKSFSMYKHIKSITMIIQSIIYIILYRREHVLITIEPIGVQGPHTWTYTHNQILLSFISNQIPGVILWYLKYILSMCAKKNFDSESEIILTFSISQLDIILTFPQRKRDKFDIFSYHKGS